MTPNRLLPTDLRARLRRSALAKVNQLMAPLNVAVIPRSTLDIWDATRGSSYVASTLPDGAAEELQPTAPRLIELTGRLSGHPAGRRSLWSDSILKDQIDLRHFRGDNAYLWQRRQNTHPAQYALTTDYVRRHDELGLLETFEEDGAFGAYVFDIDGLRVSRDLLDSVLELNFLEQSAGISSRATCVLDIGAGYGRLAHRATRAFPSITYLCTDAIPMSSFLCEYYVRFRQLEDVHVAAADEIEALAGALRPKLAVNVHSFPECPIEAISWWIAMLARSDVDTLFLVSGESELRSTEPDGTRLPFLPVLERNGYRLVSTQPKYAHSASVQEHGVFPAYYLLFNRL